MGDSSTGSSGKLDDSTQVIELKSKITVVVVTSLFLLLFFIFLIHLYVKWFLNRRREEIASANLAAAARRRFEFTPGYQELELLRRGLDPSVLKTIPVVMFTAKDFKDGLECSVCLCQVLQGEKARLLPKCNHGFHVECIDMWFQSHSSCPICRNLVSNLSPESSTTTTLESNSNSNSIPETTIDLQDYTNGERESNNNTSSESPPPPSFPTNVLFWGNDVEVRTLGNHMEEGQQGANLSQLPVSVPSYTSRSAASNNRLNGMLVIDVPQQVNDDQEAKSPAPTRLRSLKRLLSKDTRRVGPSSPRDFNVEQATRIKV